MTEPGIDSDSPTRIPLDRFGHAYPGDLTDHNDPDHTDAADGMCIDCSAE